MTDTLFHTQLVLSRMKIARCLHQSFRWRRSEDEMLEETLHRFSAEVLAEHVLDTDATVGFTGPAMVRLPRLKGALRVLRGKSVEAVVNGTVTVPATYWRRFPEATVTYPDSLGAPVRFAALGTPFWEQGQRDDA